MASHHMLAEGICLLIVCASVLSLAVPVDETPDTKPLDSVEQTQTDVIITGEESTPIPEPDIANVTLEKATTKGEITSPKMTVASSGVTLPINTTSTNQNVTKAAKASVNSTESSLTTTSSTPTRTEVSEAEGTASPDEDKSTGGSQKDPVIIEEKGDDKYRFWWSDSTWLSVVVPVSVGLGSALILICWICCFRWLCCRRCGRWRAPPYKKRIHKSSSGPAQKALREDFRQLRAKDRMKLLAESSDEEF